MAYDPMKPASPYKGIIFSVHPGSKLWHLVLPGIVALLVVFFLQGVGPAIAMSRFKPWDDQVFVAVGEIHGLAAAERLRDAHDLILENQDKPLMEKLKVANDYLNNFPWIADPILWKRDDYWATPFETITIHGGDCEDLAIAKYWILRMMGIPDENLGLAYVRNAQNMRHMVLLYMYSSEDEDAVVLDSQHPDVLPSAMRRDIIGVYLFQNNGTFYLFEDDGKNTRRFKARYEHTKLSKWAKAMEREKENDDMYAQFNGGRSLLPE